MTLYSNFQFGAKMSDNAGNWNFKVRKIPDFQEIGRGGFIFSENLLKKVEGGFYFSSNPKFLAYFLDHKKKHQTFQFPP